MMMIEINILVPAIPSTADDPSWYVRIRDSNYKVTGYLDTDGALLPEVMSNIRKPSDPEFTYGYFTWFATQGDAKIALRKYQEKE